jgi:hypothetical protein
MKSSGKFPSVDCNTPVAAGPRCAPIDSVPTPTTHASPARAIAATTNVASVADDGCPRVIDRIAVRRRGPSQTHRAPIADGSCWLLDGRSRNESARSGSRSRYGDRRITPPQPGD